MSYLNQLFVRLLIAFSIGAAPTVCAAASTSPAAGIALVIGNARYQQLPLNNPENDARVIAGNLRTLGFDVSLQLNLTVREFRRSLREFARRVQDEDAVAVLYYAGHGVQIDGRNYLLPVDINLRDQEEVKDDAVDIDDLFISKIDRSHNKARIIILDACRDNPFARRTRNIRAVAGLAEMAARGAVIAYASAPGAPAEDGPPGSNSVYTRHLAREMMVEGVEIEQMLKAVRVQVLRDTQERQIPWVNTSLTADFIFNPGRPGAKRRDAMPAAQADATISRGAATGPTLKSRSESEAKLALRSDSPSRVLVTVRAANDLNTDKNNTSAPIMLRVYLLRRTALFEQAAFMTLYERDERMLAGDLIARKILHVRPGESRNIEFENSQSGALTVAVFAAFRELNGTVWRTFNPLPEDRSGRSATRSSYPSSYNIQVGARDVRLSVVN